jgi:PKD repeat protein
MMRRMLIAIVVGISSLAANGQNLLSNPGFELGQSSWSGNATISSVRAHTSTSSMYFDNGSEYIEQVIALIPDSTYRLSFWVFLDSSFAGNDWGGVSLSAVHYDWSGQYSVEFLSPLNRPLGIWFQEYVEFIPTFAQLRIRAEMFGGGGWQPRFFIDDAEVALLDGTNEPPVITDLTVAPTSGSAPLSVAVTANVFDPDGVLRLVQHDFGDGSRVAGETAAHTYPVAGTYLYTLTAVDDQGASASVQQLINVVEPGFPFAQILVPDGADSIVVSDSLIVVGGTLTASAASATWHNRRTEQSGSIPVQANFETPLIRLEPGENWIDIQVRLPDGSVRGDAMRVYSMQTGYAGPVLTNVVGSSGTVAQYEMWEIEFDMRCAATAPTLPYDPSPPQNLRAGTGVSVDAVLSNGTRTLRWPAYHKSRTIRHNGDFIPVGESVWCVRAAFNELGVWTCVLEARDELGFSTTLGPSVLVEPSSNRGFLRVSEDDNRYFEFENGDLFLPMGFGFPLSNVDQIDQELRRWRDNRINFSRLWLSSESPFCDPWCSFATHHTMTDNGYMPPPLITTTERFDNGDVAWELGAPPQSGLRTPAIFRGFWHGTVRVLPNRTYRVTARVKTVDVTGPGGFVLKTGGWLGEAATLPGVGQAVTPYLKGSNNWCYLQGEFVSAENQYELPHLYAVLEDVAQGSAYIDQILLQEVLSDGTLTENILPKPSANAHYYFDDNRSLDYDYLIQAACTSGVYLKLVITEKDDRLLNSFDNYGYISPLDGQFETSRDSKTRRLMEYYWRHLIARYGYAVSVHSWELVNEGAPNSFADLTNHLAAFMDSAGPYPRMVTTSFWAGWQPDYWNSTQADYGDVHAYVMTTGWIDSVMIDGISYNRTMLKEDPAAAVYAYSTRIGGDPSRAKPVIIGETDLDMLGDQSPDPRLAQDSSGLWLHDFVWGHINSGGVSALVWNNSNILNHGLHEQFAPFLEFMDGIQLHEQGHQDLAAATSHQNLRAWGQRNGNGTQAHAWIKNRLHTWARVLEIGPPAPISGTVSIPSMSSGTAVVTSYNTADGIAFASDTIVVGSDSVAVIHFDNLQNDVAIKIENIAAHGPVHRWCDHFLSCKRSNPPLARSGNSVPLSDLVCRRGRNGLSRDDASRDYGID